LLVTLVGTFCFGLFPLKISLSVSSGPCFLGQFNLSDCYIVALFVVYQTVLC